MRVGEKSLMNLYPESYLAGTNILKSVFWKHSFIFNLNFWNSFLLFIVITWLGISDFDYEIKH